LTPKLIVFSDLDGTILNENYDYKEVQSAICKLISMGVSIVLASSKTKAEIEFYQRKLGINEPFIVENGSAIIIPKGYFRMKYDSTIRNRLYSVIQLGLDYASIRNSFPIIQTRSNSTIIGFGDMTIKEIAEDSGLPIELACLSKEREYDEPFKIISGVKSDILQAIESVGLSYTEGGRYLHVLGNTDKGKALAILKELYLREFHKIVTISIGNSINDLCMLDLVNMPFMINNKMTAAKAWSEILEIAMDYYFVSK
jgi:mannosyl-3-phosphoglycerate phosphatase